MQLNTTVNICIAKSCFYITCLNNYMFRPLYRPSAGCTLAYYTANCTMYSVFVFVNEKNVVVKTNYVETAFFV
jgi:hypothetical protein